MPAAPGWVWTPLSDVARLESGHTPSRKHPEYWDGDIPWIGIKDARNHHGGTIHETLQTVTQLGLDNSASRLLPARTVCLSRTASVGYVIVMGREMATSQDFVNWICSDAVDPDFLKHLFIAEKQSLLSFGEGTVHKTIYFPEVKAFHICLPPVNEQRRIVAKIESLQERSRAAREALEAIPPLLDRFRQSVLAAAFRGDLTADWRAKNPDVEPASVLLDRIRKERRRRWEEDQLAKMKAKGKVPADEKWKAKYQEPEPVATEGLPELPEGWCWASVDETSEFVTDGEHATPGRTTEGVLLLSARNVRNGWLSLEKADYISEETHAALTTRLRVRSGDVLLSCSGTVGRSCCVPDNLRFSLVRSVAVVRPIFLRDAALSLAFRSPALQAQIGRAKTQTAQSNLFQGKIKKLMVPVPPLAEQGAVLRIVDALLGLAGEVGGRVADMRAQLVTLDQSVLAKAFRGELVPQDPNDEPAAVLLERIRASRGADAWEKKEARGRSPRRSKPKKAAPPSDAEPAPPVAKPARLEPAEPKAATTAFLELDADAQVEVAFSSLLARGPMPVDDAIRQVADHLREIGASDHKRLRAGGPLYDAIDHALKLGVRRGQFDRPRRGYIRAVMSDPKDYNRDHWRAALLASLNGEPTDRDEAMRGAADWAAEKMGLEFKRLRSDGAIMKGLKSAMRSAIRTRELERVGGGRVRRAQQD